MSIPKLKFSPSAIATLLLLFTSQLLYAQDKMIVAAKKAYASKAYTKVVKMAEKALDKDKKVAEWWYLKSASEYALSQIPKYQGGKIKYDKEALKSAVRARNYDDSGEIYPEYKDVMEQIAIKNNKEALSNYASGSYAKAVQLYKISYDLTGDTIAFGMLGMSYWGDEKEMDAIRNLRKVAQWNYNAKLAGKHASTYLREPFEILSTYYLAKGYKDSALLYNEMGLTIYNKSRVLLANEKLLLRNLMIEKSREGLGEDFIALVNKGLGFFPGDTFYLYQQNYYYLTTIMDATQSKPDDSADEKLFAFYMAKSALVKAGIKNASDEFLIADSTKFLFQCLDYFLRTNTKNTTPFCFKKWYVMYNKLPEYDVNLAESLLKNPPDKISKRMISMLYEDAVEEFPWNKNFKKYRLAYFNAWMKKPKLRGELGNLLEMNQAVISDYPADKTLAAALQTNLYMAVDSSMKDGNMYQAWTYYNQLIAQFPTTKNMDQLQKRLAITDFEKRYSETRVYNFVDKGKKTPNTGWDGKSAMCQPGRMPDSTLYNVLHRINYFRQNAGIVLPMNLSYDKAQKCQEAAVMYNSKGIFTREPTPETHQCYTEGAKEAAMVAQAILEPNPAQCVTVFMNDSKSDELVNRMSVLNPEALSMGFGSAENNSVFWLLDVNGAPDSVYYQSHFVAWPPPGYSSEMLFFKKWSFSMAADLREALVTILDKNGNDVVFGATLKPLPGMLLNTLIIDTSLDPKKVTKTDFYNVTIVLKDKRKFSYRISLF